MKVVHRDKIWEFPGRLTVRDAIKKAGFHPQAVLALRDGKLLTADVVVGEDETLKLISVVSGG